ncbi:MAG: rhodanese-like domain-containing protein [Phycisphaerales bacterium]
MAFPSAARIVCRLAEVALVAVMAAVLPACTPHTTDKVVVFTESPSEAVELMTKPRGTFGIGGSPNAVWLDPRPEADFEKGHIPGAINIPFARLDAEQEFRLRGVTVIVVYDSDFDDALVKAVAKRLVAAGHKEVYVLRGGLKAWKRDGNSVETGAAAPATPARPS